MESVGRPFELDALRRPWVDGWAVDALAGAVADALGRLEAVPDVGRRGVLIVTSDSREFVAHFMAAVYLRVPVVLANPGWGRLEWAEVRALVRPACIVGRVPVDFCGDAELDDLELGDILIPTGGSSGGVKFAIHSWESLTAAWAGLGAFLGEQEHCSVCCLPLFHVSGLMQLVRSFVSGGRICFLGTSDLFKGALWELELGSYYISMVATQLQRCLQSAGVLAELRAFRGIFLGGSAVAASLSERARAEQLPIILSYGMTETAAMVAALPAADFLAGAPVLGRPFEHVCIDILDANGDVCTVGVAGRIRISGTSLFRGYRKRAARFDGVGYLTDDEGVMDADGCLRVIGRMDRLIISGGEKIDPSEVEALLLRIEGVDAALALGVEDAEWGQQLVAFYVGDAVHVKASLMRAVANFKIPKRLVRVERLPLNERGKVDRDAVAAYLEGDA